MPLQSKISALPLDVVTYIIQFCALPTLTRFASASALADQLVAKELDIRRIHLLKPFVEDQDKFRGKLTELQSVLSGSVALALCSARDAFTPADLDLYVPAHTSEVWVQYLTTQEGYRVRRRVNLEGEGRLGQYHGGIGPIVTMERDTISIDIVESLTVCATLPIPFFWTTAVMTFVTGVGIVSLFPHLLEERRGLLTPDRAGNMLHDATEEEDEDRLLYVLLEKYRSRGFDIRHDYLEWDQEMDPAAVCNARDAPACPLTMRWVGDWHTLMRRFGPVDTRVGRRVMEGTLATTVTIWRRGGKPCGPPCSAPGDYVTPHVWCQGADLVA